MQPLTVVLHRRLAIVRSLSAWQEEASLFEKLAACAAFSLLIALSAQIRLVLPFTPVPFTGEVLAVLAAGFFLGRFAPLSIGMYLGMGCAFGWFSGFIGLAAFMSVTGGYLFGFLAASAIVGTLTSTRSSSTRIILAMGLGSAVILTCGAAWLCLVFGMPIAEAVVVGILPFIVVDAVKVGIASTVAMGLSSRSA